MSEQFVFGLDIGTRSIVGSVGYLERNKFKVIAHYVKEHETRAMLDGQIHDIGQVTASIEKVKNELEAQIQTPLTEVCIAAAGRVLKTKTVHVDYEIGEETVVTGEHIYALELLGIEKAYDEIREEETGIKFYCVGYTVIKYYLNDYVIGNLEEHKGKKISADVLATFLPEEVVDGLYSAVNGANLQVANLTLEPIAAINIAIPENFRLLNIALVDVGAGTSDISITKDGSIIAYGMIPRAGDEITESLVGKYLVDFNSAESMKRDASRKKNVTFKDVMGLKKKVSSEEIQEVYSDTVDSITKEIAKKIMELNGGKSVSAVFVVGGGGKAKGFVQGIAGYLGIPEERVALRGEEVLGSVEFMQEGIRKDPLLVTPIGICLNFYHQKNNFIFINVNGQRIKLYDNDKLTVVDAAMQIGFPNEGLFPKRGEALSYYVNGKKRMARGEFGEPAMITVNNEPANIHTSIGKNDKIVIRESTEGNPGTICVEQIPEYKSELKVIVNNRSVVCPRYAQVNGKLVPGSYSVAEGDEVKILDYYTVGQLLEFMDIAMEDKRIYLNHTLAVPEDRVYDNFMVEIEDSDEYDTDTANNAYTPKEDPAEDAARAKKDTNKVIAVQVNGTRVLLQGKEKYILVDVLDFYPFDMSKALKKELVKTVNGVNCEFTQAISEGDIVELYWR